MEEIDKAVAEMQKTTLGAKSYAGNQAILQAATAKKLCSTIGKLEEQILKSTDEGINASAETKDVLKSLTVAVQNSQQSSDKLGKKLFWLNIVLAFATIVGAVATSLIAYSELVKT